jgi:uncharacterized protein (TIRG00374 family)
MKAKKLFINGLKILFTIFLLFLVFQSVDLSKIRDNLKTFNISFLLLILAVLWLGQLICSQRWRIFASSLGLKGTYRSFVQMYFVGMFFNIGLPTLVGGDIIKAFIVSRKNDRPFQIGLASVVQDRGAGMIALLAYGSVAILLCPMSWRGFPLWIAYLLAWSVTAVMLWLVVKGPRIYSRFAESQKPNFIKRIFQSISELHQALDFSRLSAKAVFGIALYSFVYSGIILWAYQLVTVAAGHPVGMIPFFALVPLINLAAMLPITPSGLGVREWLYVEGLSLAGVSREQGLIISLAISALVVLCNLAGLLFLASIPKELRKEAQEHS